MLSLIIFAIVCSFAGGIAVGTKVKSKKKLIPGTIPIANLIDDFEEFARLSEGGELSTEADAALKALRAHAERKYLPEHIPTKKDRPATFPSTDKGPWSGKECFETEMAKATHDDERYDIVSRWMRKYKFTQSWQTWSIQKMSSSSGREDLRDLFDSE